jgi:excisionase family DNA binding protein
MENSTANGDYLTIQEASGFLGISEGAVRIAILEKRLPFVTKYGRKLIKQSDVDAYKQRTQPEGVKRTGRPKKSAS